MVMKRKTNLNTMFVVILQDLLYYRIIMTLTCTLTYIERSFVPPHFFFYKNKTNCFALFKTWYFSISYLKDIFCCLRFFEGLNAVVIVLY